MVQQCGELLLPPFPCCLPYAVPAGKHACPARCPVRAVLIRIPLGPDPSLHQLAPCSRRRLRRLLRYYDRVRLLPPVHHRLRPSGLPDAGRPVLWAVKREISRFPTRSVRACRGLRPRGVQTGGSQITLPSMLPSVYATTSAPRCNRLSRLNGRPARSLSTLRKGPHGPIRMTRGPM